jgi:hexokinase
MGKGFQAANGLLGQDLGEVIKFACRSKDLNVELHAILNDGTAALLSQAYSHPSTRFGLILGTGVNIAVYLPVSAIGKVKFGDRPQGWFDEATHVVVNTELGMFGKDILPLTRWDRDLKRGHARPEFQPLEHMVSGFYLGEVCRLALVEAIETAELFGSVVPPSLREAYSLDTETLSIIEGYGPATSSSGSSFLTMRRDESSNLELARATFISRHPSSVDPTQADIAALRTLASLISRRSSALIATCVYTLWDLRLEAEFALAKSLPRSSPSREEALAETLLERTMVAFNGSVIENYPGYRDNCQAYVDQLAAAREFGGTADREGRGTGIDLVKAMESSLIGAAVALAACSEAE